MRYPILIALFLLALDVVAQDWALLNPAYKYNYSNDGTDTISNQLFVTDIDTLGPDSFLYHLNRIGVVCDTCPASLGGPCDGCYVWVDQPQFLGRHVLSSGGSWHVQGPMSWVINPTAPPGTTWLFDSTAVIYATVDSLISSMLFGQTDSIKFLSTTDGHSIVLSRSFGLVDFTLPGGSASYACVGLQGPDVGELFPQPLDYFDIPVGSALHINDHHFLSGGGFPPLIDCSSMRTITLLSRAQGPNSFTYGISCSGMFGCVPLLPVCSAAVWQVTEAMLSSEHPLTSSYPGQVVPFSDACGNPQGFTLAEHGLDVTGARTVSGALLPADSMQMNTNCSGYAVRSTVVSSTPVTPGLYPFSDFTCGAVRYTVGLGLQEHVFSSFEYGCDVIAAYSPVGIDSPDHGTSGVWPNPARDILNIDLPSGLECNASVHDLSGAQLISRQLIGPSSQLDISVLSPGAYILVVDGTQRLTRHRFVVFR